MFGCSKQISEESAYNKINKLFNNLQSYQCYATIKYISNKNTNCYKVIQSCKTSGEYKIEIVSPTNLAGTTTVFDGNTITQRYLNNTSTTNIEESIERSEIFLTSFIKNYYGASNTPIHHIANNNKCGRYITMETNITCGNPYFHHEKLLVNKETLEPSELIIYDKNDIKRIIIDFDQFQYNPKFNDDFFRISN
jgi:outer membrane lipoprotein-sorting protein